MFPHRLCLIIITKDEILAALTSLRAGCAKAVARQITNVGSSSAGVLIAGMQEQQQQHC
jgi:hypothetical protein